MDSSRLRPLHALAIAPLAAQSSSKTFTVAPATPLGLAPSKFQVGEKCLARWSDSRKFKATVQKILPNGKQKKGS